MAYFFSAAALGADSRSLYAGAVGIVVSLLLVGLGAILTWAVTAEAQGIDVNAVGVILMIVGALGLVISLVFLLSGDRRADPVVRRDRYADREGRY